MSSIMQMMNSDAIFPDYEEQTFSNLISRIPGIKHISIIIVCGGVEGIMKIIYPDTVPVLKGGYVPLQE